MSRIEVSTRDLFMRLGSTPRSRSARADKLFRRLRTEEAEAVLESVLKPAAKPSLGGRNKTPAPLKSHR